MCTTDLLDKKVCHVQPSRHHIFTNYCVKCEMTLIILVIMNAFLYLIIAMILYL